MLSSSKRVGQNYRVILRVLVTYLRPGIATCSAEEAFGTRHRNEICHFTSEGLLAESFLTLRIALHYQDFRLR